jgi:hypothetical protein
MGTQATSKARQRQDAAESTIETVVRAVRHGII